MLVATGRLTEVRLPQSLKASFSTSVTNASREKGRPPNSAAMGATPAFVSLPVMETVICVMFPLNFVQRHFDPIGGSGDPCGLTCVDVSSTRKSIATSAFFHPSSMPSHPALSTPPCGPTLNTSTSPHRLLSSALVVWGKSAGVRGAEGRSWLKVAKLLQKCRGGELVGILDDSRAPSHLPTDLEAAVRAATHMFRGDVRAAVGDFGRAADLAADGTDEATAARVPLLRYLHGRGAFAAQQWAVAASAFTSAASEMRADAKPKLPRVHKWRADSYARLGDGAGYITSLRSHVASSGECSHWPEFCLTLPNLPAGALGEAERVPLTACKQGEEPPVELLDEEARELDLMVQRAEEAVANAAAEQTGDDIRKAAEAALALATTRRHLVRESRLLECSLPFIEERLVDDVVVAAAVKGSKEEGTASVVPTSDGDGDGGASSSLLVHFRGDPTGIRSGVSPKCTPLALTAASGTRAAIRGRAAPGVCPFRLEYRHRVLLCGAPSARVRGRPCRGL